MAIERRVEVGAAEVTGIDHRVDELINVRFRRLEQAIHQLQGRAILEPLGVAPVRPYQGQIAYADGVTWDPFGDGKETLCYWDGTEWKAMGKDFLLISDAFAIFALAAYGGLYYSGAEIAFPDITAAWQPIDVANQLAIDNPRFITADIGSNTLSVTYPGVYFLSINGSFSHTESQAGRIVNLRLFNVTDATPGGAFQIGTGRNVEATTFNIGGPVEVGAGDEGDQIRVEIGGGDAYSAVTITSFTYTLHSIGEFRGALPGGGTTSATGSFDTSFGGSFS